jgi:hypothetical protein
MKVRALNVISMKFLLILFSFSIYSCQEPISNVGKFNNHIKNADGTEVDRIVTFWFDEFNNHQDQGEDMITADNLAVKAVMESTPSESVTTH